jgi:hypothetical protein
MVELDSDFGTMSMHRLRQFTQARNKFIITDPQSIDESPSPRMNIGSLNDNQ